MVTQFTTEADRFDFPLYVEAYEETIVNDEIAYINETRTMMIDPPRTTQTENSKRATN